MTKENEHTSKSAGKISTMDAIKNTTKWPLVVGCILAFISLAISFHYKPVELYNKVLIAGLAELGFAFVIAWVVLATLEVRSRQKHDKEINDREIKYNEDIVARERQLSKSIFDYLYSVRLPKQIFDFVEEKVFKAKFIKDRLKIEYEFGEIKDDWVLIRGQFEYCVKNISRQDAKFPVHFFIEKNTGQSEPDFDKTGLYKWFIDGEDDNDDFTALDNAAKDTPEYKRYEKIITLKPNECRTVRIGFYLPKRLSDTTLWQSIDLCSGLEVTIRYDKSVFDLHITEVHADTFDRKDIESWGVVVEINKPLLIRNGFHMWWSPQCEQKNGAKKSDNATNTAK